MRRSGIPVLTLVILTAACAGEESAPAEPQRPPQRTELSLLPVDASSGEEIEDGEFTVRYLVRTPITLDDAEVVEVPSDEPFRIAHAVSSDSLTVELRLESASYHTTDTVFSVAYGGTGGPFRVRMEPTEARTASRPTTPRPTPVNTAPTPTRTDRGPMLDGDEAFQQGQWRQAADAYRRMPSPNQGDTLYARLYPGALVRLGIASINLGEWQRAEQALTRAVEVDPRDYTPVFYLGQVQCALRKFDRGRSTLDQVANREISQEQRGIVLSLVDYQLAVCSYAEWEAAGAANRAAAARRARIELEEFIRIAQPLSRVPQVQAAIADARSRLERLR